MGNYPLYVTLHILLGGIWLSAFLFDLLQKNKIKTENNPEAKKALIYGYLKFINLLGMLGVAGILITGITLVVLNPGFGFFSMASNHWLATKQIVMVVILLVTFGMIIPRAKKLKGSLANVNDEKEISSNLQKVFGSILFLNILVFVNVLFALSRHLL